MATDTRSGRKNRDNESSASNSKNKLGSEGSSSPGSRKMDRSTRRAVQETSLKQVVSSPASTRKSERLESSKPSVTPVKRKSERLDQQNTSSPLRRSDRCRIDSPSTPSTSRYSATEPDSSSIRKKEKRERTVKELILESEIVSTSKENAAASIGFKRKRMDARTYKLFKRTRGGTASDAREDAGIDGDNGPRSPSRLFRDVDLVKPEERGILYDEQKSLHSHLKAEIAKLFVVLKVSEDIKHMAEKFLEYITENHRVSREPETILQAFQISLCWIAASLLKQKIDKDDIFVLVKQHLQFRCTKEEVNNVYLKLRSLKKTFLHRLDHNGNSSNTSRSPISSVKSVGEEPYKGSMSQAVVSTQPNVITESKDRLQDKEFSGEDVVSPQENFMDNQREKIIREVQYRHDRRISMLGQKQQKEIEEFHRIWGRKKEVLEEEYRLELAVFHSIHGRTAATKDRQQALETEFARKMEAHKCLKDQQLKEIEVKYSAKRNEKMQKFSSWCTRKKFFLGSHYNIEELHFSDSGNETECSQETLNVSDNIHRTVDPACGQHVELLCPGNVVYGSEGNMTASDAHLSSPVECHVLPVQSTGVLASSVSEEQTEITSTERALVAAVEQSNEADNSGGSKEEIACEAPLPPTEHTGEVASDKRSRACSMETSENAVNEVVGDGQISNTKNSIPESNSHLPKVVENQRHEGSSIDGNDLTAEELSVDLPCVEAVPTSDNASSLPQNPVYLDECSRSSGDNGAQDNSMPLSENQIGIQIEAVAGCSINNTSEAMLVDSCERQHTVVDGVSVATHHTRRESAAQTHDTRYSIPIPGSSPHLDEDTAEPLHQAVSPAGKNLETCVTVVAEPTLANTQSTLPEVSTVQPQFTTDPCASSRNTETAFQVVQSSAELPSQPVSRLSTNVAFVQRPSDIPLHPADQMATRNSALPSHADPLHIEWERIHKEKEQVTKGHEDMKSRLRSECKKEIEDIIASIRKKYDIKLQEEEAAYILKKNELDMNQNKILRNKFLADAFRFKCLDLKISVLPGIQQVGPPGYVQHSLRSSPATGLSSAPACSRSSPVSGLSSAHQPVEGQQTSVPASPVANCSLHSGGISQPTLRSTPVGDSSSSDQPAASQQIPAVRPSTAYSTGIVRRPLLINTITPSRGNLRLGGEIRAPAPHLQPFRPPTSASGSALPTGMQGHSRPPNVAASSPSYPQVASLQSSVPLQIQQHQIQPPIVPQLPLNLSDSRNTLGHGLGGMHAIQNPSLSAQELLREMENQCLANRPNVMPPLPDIDCNFDSLDLSDFHSMGRVQGGSTSSVTATNAKNNAEGSNRGLTKFNLGRGSFGEIYGVSKEKPEAMEKLEDNGKDRRAPVTTSVLHEAYTSIKALRDRIQDLCNMARPSYSNDSLFQSKKLTDEDVFHENMTVMDDVVL